MRHDTVQYLAYLPKVWAWRLQIHYSLSFTLSNADLDHFIHLYSAIFWCLWKSYCLWILPKNSYETHMTSPKTHVFIHTWWTQMKVTMNINILMKNTTTFLCSSWITQQHFDGQNVYPDFQVKISRAQDTWQQTIGDPTTTIWAQKLYK